MNDFAVGDADNDGDLEIVANLRDGLGVFHRTGSTWIWSFLPEGGYEVEIGDIDRDGRREIVGLNGEVVQLLRWAPALAVPLPATAPGQILFLLLAIPSLGLVLLRPRSSSRSREAA